MRARRRRPSPVRFVAPVRASLGNRLQSSPHPINAALLPPPPPPAASRLHRMSSGLRFDENMENPRAHVMRMLLDVGDAAALATKQELIAPPGTRWQYQAGTSNIIARVVRNTLRNDSESLLFPRQALFDCIRDGRGRARNRRGRHFCRVVVHARRARRS